MTKLTVLVTGATAGFGQAIAKRYLAEGHKVVAAGRRGDRLEELKKSLPADQQVRISGKISGTMRVRVKVLMARMVVCRQICGRLVIT